ncbi:Uncharacterised protein [Vibrio cholerae]|nr:Uncharacterised protein [Vibrio cholerae]
MTRLAPYPWHHQCTFSWSCPFSQCGIGYL